MSTDAEKIQKTIAVTGKGGAGKTVLSTLMIKILVERKNMRILAVDADSAKGLTYTLGMTVGKTVSDFRRELIDNPQEKRRISDLHMGKVIGEIVAPGPGFDLLVMGRPEAPGCFCAVNDLLRYGIESLSRNYDITIIDGEAGPEQINRRVMQHLNALLVVSETSARSLEIALEIMKVAQNQGIIRKERMGLVINKFKEKSERTEEFSQKALFDVWGHIPYDENISRYDSLNRPLLELPDGSPGLAGMSSILGHIF